MNRIPRFASLSTILLLAVATLASPPPKMNLSGKWSLNEQKSDFGPLPPPTSRVDDITQKGDHITIVRTQVNPDGKSATLKLDCPIGGADCTTTYSSNAATVKAKAAWEGEALAIDMTLTSGENELKVHDVYTLSADGKVLTTKRHVSTAMGEGDLTLVLDKQ